MAIEYARILFLTLLFLSLDCSARDKSIIGLWEWDGEKTLADIKYSRARQVPNGDIEKSLKFVSGLITKAPEPTKIFFAKDKYVTITVDQDGNLLTSDTASYKISKSEEDFFVINSNGYEDGRIYYEKNYLYTIIRVGSYEYKDYYRKIR
jgi:hypothetical protein